MSTAERRGALAGVAFAILAIGGNLLQGSVPVVHGPPSEARDFYLGHPDRIAIGMALALLGVMLLIWFIAVLRDVIATAEGTGPLLGTIVQTGSTVGATLLAAGLALNAAGALRAREHGTISEDLSVAFFDGSFVLMGLASASGLAVAMIATGVAAFTLDVLPRWVGWLSVLFAVPGVLAPVAWTLLLLFPIWTMIVGVVISRRRAAVPGGASRT